MRVYFCFQAGLILESAEYLLSSEVSLCLHLTEMVVLYDFHERRIGPDRRVWQEMYNLENTPQSLFSLASCSFFFAGLPSQSRQLDLWQCFSFMLCAHFKYFFYKLLVLLSWNDWTFLKVSLWSVHILWLSVCTFPLRVRAEGSLHEWI